MVATLQLLAQNAAARAAAEPPVFKPGQLLEATVLGKTAEGMTALKIGDLVITARLPQPLPAGTILQLQVVRTGGTAPQLAMVGTPQVPVSATPVPAPLPLPPTLPQVLVAPAPMLPEPARPSSIPNPAVTQAPDAPSTLSATSGQPAPAPATNPQPAAPATSPQSAAPALGPQAAASATSPQPAAPAMPSVVPAGPEGAVRTEPAMASIRTVASLQSQPPPLPASAPPAATGASPIAESPQTLAQVSGTTTASVSPASAGHAAQPPVTQPAQAPTAVSTSQSKPAAPAAPTSTGPSAAAPSAVTSPSPQATLPSGSPPVQQSAASPVAGAGPLPAGGAPLAATGASVSPASAQRVQPSPGPVPSGSNAAPATPAPPLPVTATTAALPSPAPANVAPTLSTPPTPAPAASLAAAVPPAAPAIPQPSQSVPQSAPAPAPLAAEPTAASPLLVAQGATRSPEAPAPFARAPASPAVPAQAASLPPSTSPPVPATPAAALAQMIPEAMARQNSVAPLLASLAAVVAKPGALPEPVLRAALQVLGQRLQLPASGPTALALKTAIEKSGVFLEASLAKTGAPAADMKSALTALKSSLATWLGGNPAPVDAARQAAPPLRGMPPRVQQIDAPPLPDGVRDVGRILHHQADAALSRVKLMQLASLPDADPARPVTPELRTEIPFLIGSELVMAQFQVTRDAARRKADGKRGWTLRFAMNFSGTGEVGAEVGLIGRSVSVALWAAEAETARRLEAALPELAPALAGLGLEAGAIRVRSSPPAPEPPPSGRYLDSLR